MLSKSQEIQLFGNFIKKCPEGYVRSILESIQVPVEAAISNDFAFIEFDERVRQTNEHRVAMSKATAELKELESRTASLRRDLEGYQREMDNVRSRAAKIASGTY